MWPKDSFVWVGIYNVHYSKYARGAFCVIYGVDSMVTNRTGNMRSNLCRHNYVEPEKFMPERWSANEKSSNDCAEDTNTASSSTVCSDDNAPTTSTTIPYYAW